MYIKLALLFIYGSFLIALSIFKTSELFLPQIYQFEALLGGDKWMHFKLSSLLAFIALLTFTPATKEIIKLTVRTIIICFLLAAGLLMDEFHQALASTRRFEWLDFIYGLSGIGLGLVCYLITLLLRRKYQPESVNKFR